MTHMIFFSRKRDQKKENRQFDRKIFIQSVRYEILVKEELAFH